MSIDQSKIETYQQCYNTTLEPVRVFDNGTDHPVVLFLESDKSDKGAGKGEMSLMCACDFEWRWVDAQFGKQRVEMLAHTRDGFNCPARKDARDLVRREVAATYSAEWAQMSLADAVYDIYKKNQSGEFMGEFTIGMLYLQDVEALLREANVQACTESSDQKDARGNFPSLNQVKYSDMPQQSILDAVAVLKKRKLIDLYDNIMIPHEEHFRFPDTLHHLFAYWIEIPLGRPNGDAGACYMYDLYKRITAVTKWKTAEGIFGPEQFPDLSESVKKVHLNGWLSSLDVRFVDTNVADKSVVLAKISIPQWIAWLSRIREEMCGKST